MLKSNIDVFFVTSFLCSLKFLLFYRIEYPNYDLADDKTGCHSK